MPEEPSGEDGAQGDTSDREEAAPLQDLADRIRDEREPDLTQPGGSDAATSDYFVDESSDPIDAEVVWQAIESDSRDIADPVNLDDADGEHVVPKRWYCERCEYFSEPPEVHCSHSGTTILEYVGTEEVRVRNCPVVAERMALGQFKPE